MIWILYDDFNMIEHHKDKMSLSPIHWITREREAWFFMKSNLRLLDPNYYVFPTNFTS